jgi:hypothetical protein
MFNWLGSASDSRATRSLRRNGVRSCDLLETTALAQWKTRPASMTTVWPVIVSLRHIVTTISAQSSLVGGLLQD